MQFNDYYKIVFFFILLIGISPILGAYIAKVLTGKKTILSKIVNPVEKSVYQLTGIKFENEMNWKEYLFSILIFNLIGFIILFLILILQGYLPLNPQKLKGMKLDLAFNTAVSFVTNTNWQAYAGESTLSYFSQMIGLAVQNFLSAATGICVFIALARGFSKDKKVGNFWIDLTRIIIYILLPLSIIISILLMSQGVIQTFSKYQTITTLEGSSQIIPLGPAASQIAIKQLGTNGGGFFGVNSSHPFENPTPFSNFIEMLAILLIPSALVFTYGRIIGSNKHAIVIYSVMLILLLSGLAFSLYSEYSLNPIYKMHSPVMEGKETRFGITESIMWSVFTTAASNGSVNSMHDSLSPMSGFVAILNIMLGEIIFGGVGAGMYGMIMFIILTVFIAGLMVGRTPEYMGKKIEKREIKMAMLAVMAPIFIILILSALSLTLKSGIDGITNNGPHGLTQILYAFSSAAGNNGSAFAGLSANTIYYNITTGIGMILGRFLIIIPSLIIAGSASEKTVMPKSEGTFNTDTLLFAFLLFSVIIIVGALTFIPVLTLGPVLEHILMNNGITF